MRRRRAIRCASITWGGRWDGRRTRSPILRKTPSLPPTGATSTAAGESTAAAAQFGPDYSPRTLKVDRFNDTTRTPALDVTVDGKHATVVRNGASATIELPSVAFPISQYTPVSQHLALLRYWKAHGSPASLAVFPGDPLNPVKIRQQGVDELPPADGVSS